MTGCGDCGVLAAQLALLLASRPACGARDPCSLCLQVRNVQVDHGKRCADLLELVQLSGALALPTPGWPARGRVKG